MKSSVPSTENCQRCDSQTGFYRLNGAMWCNSCGHRKGERKEIGMPPTSAPEIQIRRLANGK